MNKTSERLLETWANDVANNILQNSTVTGQRVVTVTNALDNWDQNPHKCEVVRPRLRLAWWQWCFTQARARCSVLFGCCWCWAAFLAHCNRVRRQAARTTVQLTDDARNCLQAPALSAGPQTTRTGPAGCHLNVLRENKCKTPHPCSYFAHLATPAATFATQQQARIYICISSRRKTSNKLKQGLQVHHPVFAACTQHSVWMTQATWKPHTCRCFLLLLIPHRRAEGGRVAHVTNDALRTESVT